MGDEREGDAPVLAKLRDQEGGVGDERFPRAVSYSGLWRANGGAWQELPETLTVAGNPQRLQVRTATPHLTG